MKSFRPKDDSADPPTPGRNSERNFRGERRKRYPRLDHRAGRAADSQGAGQGSAARLHRACADGEPQRPGGWRGGDARFGPRRTPGRACAGRAPCRAAGVTLGADKGYDTDDFVMELREQAVTPHVAQNQSGRRSAIDGRTTRHAGYAMSLCLRKRIEEVFGCGTAACPRATGNSLWQWPLMTLSDCWSRPCRDRRNRRSATISPSPLHRHHYRRSHRSDSRIEPC
jgi:hypothetical protein